MGLFINSNSAALNAQRNLLFSQQKLSRSFERLSSGLRVNSAKDDAAGLSIATRFTSQIRGLNQAVRNSNDAVSLAQVAEGALQESTNVLQRIRELAVQAASDVNNSSDRESLDAEVQQLVSELDRIATTTNFNNQNILDGSFTSSKFHVGANARESFSVSTGDARAGFLGRAAVSTTATVASTGMSAGDVVINAVTIRATVAADDTVSTSQAGSSALAKANAINDSFEFTGVKARAIETAISGTNAVAGGTLDNANTFSINGETFTGFNVQADDATGEMVSQINAVSGDTGVIASLDVDHNLVLTAVDGRNIEVGATGTGATISGLAAGVYRSSIELQSDDLVNVTGGALSSIGYVGNQVIGVSSNNAVDTTSVLDRESANRTIEVIDRALEQVSGIRSGLGAVQNRLESTISNLTNVSENLSASRSRIVDADFAKETSLLARNQILQQAGTSILAQANQQPSQVLALLG